MSPRRYRMSQRAQSAEQTRRRIVEATFALHTEKGVAATTFRDISTRADVGLGTVYHHFPSYEDVITACGQYTFAITQPPHSDIFVGTRDPAERIRVLVRELFAFYRRAPALSRIRAERHLFAALDHDFAGEEANRRALIAAALHGSRAGAKVRALAFAVLDVGVYESLIASGVEHDAAVDEITNILVARLRAKRSRP